MKELPGTVKVTLGLVLLNALVWLVFGGIVVAGVHPALHVSLIYKWGIALVSFLAAGVLVALFLLLRKRWKPAWYLSVAALAITSLLTIFDEVGLIDILVLGGMLIPLVLLIIDRKWYLGKQT
jgi:peptidoglycan/LPS O-acetylase OafA/YrhL